MVLLINVRFAEFEKGLVGLNSGTNLVLDVTGLGLNAAGALSGQSAAQILSAIAGGLAGTKSAINNDVLLQKSVEVIIQQMITDRAQAYQVILAREDPNGDNPYTTMQQAAIDLYAFAAAGTWSNAISNLQACTGAQAQAGTTEVRTMKKKGAKKAAAARDAVDKSAAANTVTNSSGCGSSGT
jgi:predicted Fe-Mo cluster-binding NifX family protein